MNLAVLRRTQMIVLALSYDGEWCGASAYIAANCVQVTRQRLDKVFLEMMK